MVILWRVFTKVMEQGGTVLDQYAIPYDDICFGPTIGEGSFGTVLEGLLRGETKVAVKTMRVEKVSAGLP